MKNLLLVACLAIGLSACASSGFMTEDEAVALRADLRETVSYGESAVAVGNFAVGLLSTLPPCDGVVVLCFDPANTALLREGIAAVEGALTDIRAALAEGITDAERAGILTAALTKAAEKVNAIAKQLQEQMPDAVIEPA